MYRNQEFPLDLSEIEGRKFVCLDNCHLCCLCQPELLEDEERFFRKDFPDKIVSRRTPHRHTALAMKQGGGPCIFLDEGRCSVYQQRPHYCRAFPFHVYLGDRAQVELDLSCRGAWGDQGADATVFALELVEENRERIARGLKDSSEVYEQFRTNCADAGIDPDPSRLRKALEPKLALTSDPLYLGRLLDLSLEEDEMSLPERFETVEKGRMEELRQAAMETALDSLSSMDPMSSPVYCDESGRWTIFMSSDYELELYEMTKEGSLSRTQTVDPNTIPLLAPEGDGAKLFVHYIGILNRRDSMLGHAYFLVDDLAYEDYVSNVYYGAMATAALDLLWRGSLLAHMRKGRLDREGVKEAIIYYDMDRLDAPTIGAFV
ncbi:MAG: YkgJ family cysteine cluster protein [Methanomassiliicoccales archaeon]